ncbi:MAG TPA: class I SAM-dependent methyltransferase, partial [Allocoleopsis sp.]
MYITSSNTQSSGSTSLRPNQDAGSLKQIFKRMLGKVKRSLNPYARKNLGLDQRLYNYLLSVSLREPEILQQLRQETAKHAFAGMQIAPEQGQLMALLVQLIGAQKVLEVGVFTGYSSLSVALALPEQGHIVACDIDRDFTAIAQRYWKQAGVDHKIDLRLAPGLQTLDELIAAGQAGSFDFAFIDADKENHPHYYEKALQLVRSGGLILIDNALWFGKVANPKYQDSATQAIRKLNQSLL